MYFRFGSAVVLVTLVSVAGVAIEKHCLALRRAITRQHYRQDALSDQFGRLRLQTQQLGAPARLLEVLENRRLDGATPEKPDEASTPRGTFLAWQRGRQADP